MNPLSQQNIESEVSYAYLHAIASLAGFGVKVGSRHDDNNGIDAVLTSWGPFPKSYQTEIDIKVQLKATITVPADDGSNLPFFVKGRSQYDDLRAETISVPRILVVLFLPALTADWSTHTAENLMLRRCAYWQSLRGAPPTDNDTGATIKLPKSQMFSVEQLNALAHRIAARDIPIYPKA